MESEYDRINTHLMDGSNIVTSLSFEGQVNPLMKKNGTGNGLMPPGNNPLAETVFTDIYELK